MKINKYLIKESHEFFTYVFNICDKNETVHTSMRMGTVTSKIKPFVFNGSVYEIEKDSAFSHNRLVYRDGIYIGTISQKAFTYDFRIFTENSKYTIKSNYAYKNITVLEGSKEVGKVSRKTHWFKSNFGIALSEDIDPILVFLAVVFKLYVMRAGMAA